MKNLVKIFIVITTGFLLSCEKEQPISSDFNSNWERSTENPVFRDLIPEENYQAASDAHVFYDENGSLKMIYTGDVNGVASIKLATGRSFTDWEIQDNLLFDVGPSGKDISKETSFYRKASNGKHQIYYIGYDDEDTYQSEIYLAEADELKGPYTQMETPIIPRGTIADKEVYLITSPSIVEHKGQLYISFIGWNNSPDEVTEVWIIGAISNDDGHTWTNYQIVETRIGMEGQVTKIAENEFVAVRTGDFDGKEAIFYATAAHPFGPWAESPIPILVQQENVLEKDEIIAPQITIDINTGDQYLYYTGADYQLGWWIMMAKLN